MFAHDLDAVCGYRMGAPIEILDTARDRFPIFQNPEKFHQAARGDFRPVEKTHRRLVGGRLVGAGMTQQAAFGERDAARNHRLRDAGVSRGDARGGAERRREDRLCRPVLDLVLEAGEMAACNMARLMRDHTDNLAGIPADPKQAGVQEYPHPVGNEGVHLVAIHQMQAYAFRRKAGRFEDRIRIEAKRFLDLRVTDQVKGPGFRRRGGRTRKKCGEEAAEKGSHGPHGWRPRKASRAS